MDGTLSVAVAFAVFIFIVLIRSVRIVPQQMVFVVERLGKFNRKLDAGLHIIIPFMDAIRYKHSYKEVVLDIPEQICITRDNVQVAVDGILFFRVIDPVKASYGVASFVPAIIQLAQTTLRSEVGKLDLDKTFEERERTNNAVVLAIDAATDSWGVKVLRYEIKSITPPQGVLDAMEKQMKAEREKRAQILVSEGDRDSKINRAEGIKQETIKNSEADMQRSVNEANGQARAILEIAKATADGLKMISDILNTPGGQDAARLRVAEAYVQQFGNLAKTTNTVIIPASVGDLSGMLASAFSVFNQVKPKA